MSKALLVAQREFMENMRTKTFWLGILSFPIIIGLAIVVGKMFEESKDVRHYAVLDQSEGQWLSREIADQAAMQDYAELLRDPERFAEMLSRLPEDHALRTLQTRMEALDLSDEERADLESGDARRIPARVRAAGLEFMQEMFQNPGQLQQLQADLSINKYRKIEVANLDLSDEPEKQLGEMLNTGELFAYFVIGEDPVTTDDDSHYVSNNRTDEDLRKWFESRATEIVRAERIRRLDLSPADARSILSNYRFEEGKVNKETGERETIEKGEKESSFAPVAFVYLLWIAVFTAANMLLTNTVEEKSNRLIEVLLSSVSPLQLMAGKVIGIGATGLTIVLSWVGSALIGMQFAPSGIEEILTPILSDPVYLSSFVAYFLVGYLLYAAFLVAIGSVCNSLKEAQSLMQPVFVVLMVPLIAMIPVVQDPNGTIAKVLTYIPLFTPFLMMNRASGPPEMWEYAATTVLMLISLFIAFWGAAKVFRVGILMTGKPPKIREIFQWLRAPVGQVAVRTSSAPTEPGGV